MGYFNLPLVSTLVALTFLSFRSIVSAQAAGDGKDGVMCSSTDLSATLLKAAGKVSGVATEDGSPFSFALDGIQIIKNFDKTSSNLATTVGGKTIECVYKAQVDFATSAIKIYTGPPGVEADTKKQRCWTLKTNDTSVLYKITDYDSCKTSVNVNGSLSQGYGNSFGYTGSVAKGSADIPDGFGATCPKTSNNKSPVLEKYAAVGSGDFWLRSGFWAQVITPSAQTLNVLSNPPKIEVHCFADVANPDPVDSLSGRDPYSIFQATTVVKGTTSCVTFEPHYALGGIFVLTQSGACSALTKLEPIPKNSNYMVFVASFPNYVPEKKSEAAAAVDPAAASVYKGPAEVKSVPVISFTNDISGLSNTVSILAIADPCIIVPLRINQAAALGMKVENVLITQVKLDNGKTVSIPATSLANTYKIKPSDCGSGSRRLLRELREGIDFVLVAEAVSTQARMLQATTATISTNAVVTSSDPSKAPTQQEIDALKSTITNAPAPALPSGAALNGGEAKKPTAPVATSAILSVPIVWERKVVYKVDEVITFFNNVPRRCLASCEGEATNKFNIPPSMTYIQGALGVAAGMFALAVINLIIYIPSYMCGLCACTSCRCRKPRQAGSFKKVLGVRTFFVLFGIIEIGMLVAAISYIPRFPLGFQQIIDGVFMFVDTLGLAGRYLGDASCLDTPSSSTYRNYGLSKAIYAAVAGGAKCDSSVTCCPLTVYNKPTEFTFSLGHAASIVSETAKSLVTACGVAALAPKNDFPCPDAIKQGLNGVIDGMKSAIEQSVDMGKTITGSTSTFKDLTSTLPLEQIKAQLSQAGMGVIATLIFWVFCFSIFVFQNTFNCCMFGLCSTAMIPLATILMILAGLYYAIAILGSDFCVDPYTIIKNFFPKDGMIGETLNYYLSCGDQPNTEVKGILLMFNPILDMINTAITMIKTMGDQIAADPSDPSQDPFVRLRDSKDAALGMSLYASQMSSALNGIKGTVSCQQIDPIIATFLNGFCTNTIATIGGIARIFVACSVFLFFQIGMGIDLCCFHPGYTSRYVTDDPDAQDDGAGKPKPMIITGVKAPKIAGSNPMHHSHV